MAGQTNHAFRTICREQGGVGLVCTELFSSNAMQDERAMKGTYEMKDWTPDESPFAVQLFGNDPQRIANAAKWVVDHGADIVDINMGCWVPKVAKKRRWRGITQRCLYRDSSCASRRRCRSINAGYGQSA